MWSFTGLSRARRHLTSAVFQQSKPVLELSVPHFRRPLKVKNGKCSINRNYPKRNQSDLLSYSISEQRNCKDIQGDSTHAFRIDIFGLSKASILRAIRLEMKTEVTGLKGLCKDEITKVNCLS